MKNTMKTMAMLAIMLFANIGFAQNKKSEAINNMATRLSEKLALSNEQQSKVIAVLNAHALNMKNMREQMRNNPSPEDRMKVRKAAWDKMDKDIIATLSDEQAAKYNTYKQEMRRNWRDNSGARGQKEDKETGEENDKREGK